MNEKDLFRYFIDNDLTEYWLNKCHDIFPITRTKIALHRIKRCKDRLSEDEFDLRMFWTKDMRLLS